MTTDLRLVAVHAALSVLALASLAPAQAQTQLVWSQPVDGYAIIESSQIASPPSDVEAADDFDLVGTVERILVAGNLCFGCGPIPVDGVWVRFYAWDDGAPGALQRETFLAGDDPSLVYDAANPTTLDITLTDPFIAGGRHFVSVQLVTPDNHLWRWWTSGDGSPKGSVLHQRDNLADGPWETSDTKTSLPARDLAFQLWGIGPPPPPEPELLWLQSTSLFAGETPSGVWPGNDSEAADDFDLFADVTDFLFRGGVPFGATEPDVTGVRVRFYSWQAGVPGAVQYDETLLLGDGLEYWGAGLWWVILPEAFAADGRHFLSVQLLASNENDWGWSHANEGDATLAGALVRDGSGAWVPIDEDGASVDLSMHITGIDKTPPVELLTDPCGDWQVIPLDTPPDLEFMVSRDLDVAAADDVWMVGGLTLENGDGGPFSMHFDGDAWTLIDTPAPEPYPGAGGVGLDAIEAVAPSDVWAAGHKLAADGAGFIDPQPFVLRWDGSDWSEIPAPMTATGAPGSVVRDIEVVAPDELWFVGDWGSAAGCDGSLAMRWDGSGFTRFDTPCVGIGCDQGGYGLEAASAVASDDVWAVGGAGASKTSICSYVIHWDGSSWSYVASPEPGTQRRLYDVEAIASDDVWAVGVFIDAFGYHAYAIHWDGRDWTVFSGDDFPTGGGALHAFASDDVYAGGGGISRWDGTAWSFVEDLGQSSGEHLGVSLTALDAVSPCELWTGGRQVVAGEIVGLSARQVSDQFWALLPASSCDGSAPPDSLVGLTAPVLGGVVSVAIDDPLGVSGITGGTTLWAIGFGPPVDEDCGDPLPGYGLGGAPGSLFLDASQLALLSAPVPWTGPGQPSVHTQPIPSSPHLAGVRLYTQGLIVGAEDTVLTDGLTLQLGQ